MSAAHRHPLTVELAIRDGKITRRYQTRETAWDGPSEPLKQITTKGPGGKSVPLKTLTEWLTSLSERPEETDQLEPQVTGPGLDVAGDLLFKILFGASSTEDDIVKVMDRVWPERGKLPTFAGVRVRIVVKGTDNENAKLVGLPWMATQWCKHLLIDKHWTFESVSDSTRDAPIQLRSPPKALILAPGSTKTAFEDKLRTREHLSDLKAVWEGERPGWTEPTEHQYVVAASVESARAALVSFQPEIVYYYGHGIVDQGLSYLALPSGSASRVLLRDLLNIHLPELRRHPPAILFLNACGLGRVGWHSAGHLLGDHIPVVIANVSPVRGSTARELGHQFWKQVVREHRDPVVVAHDRVNKARAASGSLLDTAAVVVTAHYGSVGWRHAPGVAGRERMRRAFDLDRGKQRGHFSYELKRTIASGVRAHAVIAHGAVGNLVEKAPVQLSEYLQSEEGQHLQIRVCPLRRQRTDPLNRLALEAALHEAAQSRSRHGRPGNLAECLRALSPSRLGDVKPIVWLDAGHVVAGPETSAHLAEFMAFLSDVAPDDAAAEELWVIGSLAIETTSATAPTVEPLVDNLTWNSGLRAKVAINVLAPFEEPPLRDVVAHLERDGVDRSISADLAAALLWATGGAYDQLVAHLDAQRTVADFTSLLRRLTREMVTHTLESRGCAAQFVEGVAQALLDCFGDTRFAALRSHLRTLETPIDGPALLRRLSDPHR